MNKRFLMTTLAALAIGVMSTSPAEAGKKPKNLQVIDASVGKKLGKGMKLLTKGLGVKCVACHVKGKLDLDDVKTKLATRKFIEETINGPTEPSAREKKALVALLKVMKLDAAKDEAKIWKALTMWRVKK
jgi:hypothetical protein